MRRLIFIGLIVSFCSMYYLSLKPTETAVLKTSFLKFEKMVKNSTLSVKSKVGITSGDETGSQSASNPADFNPEQIQTWIETESRSMNSTNNDTDEKQIRLSAEALALGPVQLATLKSIAVDYRRPVNSRIFSAYMLTLNPSEQSQESLFDVAKTEVPDFGPLNAHSEAELRHSQELAIRYMEVDELFRRAKTNSNSFDKLKLLAQEAQSAQVRSYAEKKLKELK